MGKILKNLSGVARRSFASLPGKVENAWNTSDVFDHHEEGLSSLISGKVEPIKEITFGKNGFLRKAFSEATGVATDNFKNSFEWPTEIGSPDTWGNMFEEFGVSDKIDEMASKIDDFGINFSGIGGNIKKIISGGGELTSGMISNFSQYDFNTPDLSPLTGGTPSFKSFNSMPSGLGDFDGNIFKSLGSDPGKIPSFIRDVTGKNPESELPIDTATNEAESAKSEIKSKMSVVDGLSFGDISLEGLDGLEGIDILSNEELINGVDKNKPPSINDIDSILNAGDFDISEIENVSENMDMSGYSFDNFNASELDDISKFKYADVMMDMDSNPGISGVYPLPSELTNIDFKIDPKLMTLMNFSNMENAYKLPINNGSAAGEFAENMINNYNVDVFGFPLNLNTLAFIVKELLPTTGQFQIGSRGKSGHKINTRITHQKTSDPFKEYLDWGSVKVDTKIEEPMGIYQSKTRFSSDDFVGTGFDAGLDAAKILKDLLK